MTKLASIKPYDIEQYNGFDLHKIESVIHNLEQSANSFSQPKLHAARQALRHRQRLIKANVMEFEQSNDQYLLFFDSTSNFSKLAGRSVLFFSLTVADRIHWRYSVKLDSDHYSVSEDGIISFCSLKKISQPLADIGILPDEHRSTSELHFYRLSKVYTAEQIAKLRDHTGRDVERLTSTVLPNSPLPLLYDAIIRTDHLIYYQFKHATDRLARETIGKRLILESYDLLSAYVDFANHPKSSHARSYLEQIIKHTNKLYQGMLYAGRLGILHHQVICQIFEQLGTISRISKSAYQKLLNKK